MKSNYRGVFPRIAACVALWVLFAATPAVCKAQQTAADRKPLSKANWAELRDGDIVFIESNSENAKDIKELTKSDLTHCGIVFQEGEGIGGLKVREGAGRGKYLSLADWQIAESPDRRNPNAIFVRRLKDRDKKLTSETLRRLKIAARELHETKYDKGFAWENKYTENGVTKEYVYCSELVWKAFDKASDEPAKIHVGSHHRIDKYISDAKTPEEVEAVKAILKAKLNNDVSRPYRKSLGHPNGEDYKDDEQVISPEEVFKSDQLESVTD